ncbi:MAG: squalene/phytoene synthase family protein [Anaerolineae bacterium]|nr:squalene/phytoene synthase family protein [Anaerolineae bacterium]
MEYAQQAHHQTDLHASHSVIPHEWEHSLLEMAKAGLHHIAHPFKEHTACADLLEQAYTHCEEITRRNSKTFHMASALMPHIKRRSIHALYAFCRACDDIMDKPESDDPSANLEEWRMKTTRFHPDEKNLVALAWHVTCLKHSIPTLYAEQLIEGVKMDLTVKRYQTFSELAEYCYSVASTVGLMSMHIIGFHHQQAMPYAIRLGVALQLTNILRDVGEDYRMGRLYLPREELVTYGIREEDIAAGRVTDNWRQFMKFQIERARELYATSLPGVKLLDKSGRFATYAAGILYARILDEIEKNDYDVFTRRAHTSKLTKLKLLPVIWWKSITE